MANAREDHIDIAGLIVKGHDRIHLTLDIDVRDDRHAPHRGDDRAEIHLLAQAQAGQRCNKVGQANEPPDDLGHPIQNRADDAADDRNTKDQSNDEPDHIQHEVHDLTGCQCDSCGHDASGPGDRGSRDTNTSSNPAGCQCNRCGHNANTSSYMAWNVVPGAAGKAGALNTVAIGEAGALNIVASTYDPIIDFSADASHVSASL